MLPLAAGITSSNPSVVFCRVEVIASDRSLVQRSPTECGVSEYDRETSLMRTPWARGGVGGGVQP